MRVKLPPISSALALILPFVAACSSSSTTPTLTLASLVVSCDATRLTSAGQQAHCTARAALSNGQTEDRTGVAQWASSDPSRATVNGGLVTAVAPGSVEVTAKIDTTIAKQAMTVELGCAFSLSPAVAAFGADGGSQVVTVSASPDGCAPSTWTAASNGAGLTVSPAQGSGNGTVTVSAAPNGTQSQARTATIAGQTFTANVGAACTVGFSPAGSENTGPGAGQRDVAVVVANAPCRWTASSTDPWITLSQTEGTTSTTVRVSFAQNTGGQRTGSVTFSGPDCNPQCRTSSMTVLVRQARAMSTLSLTLEQGEHLSGPYAGVATGPNGYSCTLTQTTERIACPSIDVPTGTSVKIVITLTVATFDFPIFYASGCDARGGNSCTVEMNGDRRVTIGVGCGTICGVEPDAFDAIEPDGTAFLHAETRAGVARARPELASDRAGKYR